jgi:hypothetical protein
MGHINLAPKADWRNGGSNFGLISNLAGHGYNGMALQTVIPDRAGEYASTWAKADLPAFRLAAAARRSTWVSSGQRVLSRCRERDYPTGIGIKTLPPSRRRFCRPGLHQAGLLPFGQACSL